MCLVSVQTNLFAGCGGAILLNSTSVVMSAEVAFPTNDRRPTFSLHRCAVGRVCEYRIVVRFAFRVIPYSKSTLFRRLLAPKISTTRARNPYTHKGRPALVLDDNFTHKFVSIYRSVAPAIATPRINFYQKTINFNIWIFRAKYLLRLIVVSACTIIDESKSEFLTSIVHLALKDHSWHT